MPSSFLHMPLKVPPRNDLVHPLAHWLDDDQQHVGYDDDGDGIAAPSAWIVPKPGYSSVDCRKELLRLAALRNCLSESLMDWKAATEDNALRDCQDYHATLLKFEQQGFPSVETEATLETIHVAWKNAFDPKGPSETHHSLVWDRVGCLWNVAAIQSYQAATTCDLNTKDGCKSAISLYQAAASILTILRELVDGQDYASVDCSSPMLQFWETLFKAQAQHIIYKMANLNSEGDPPRQHTTLSYLIQAAAQLYNETLEFAKDPRLQSELTQASKQWATRCKAQSLVCQARATFHTSIDCRLKQDHGVELARLSQCVQQLQECHEFWKSAALDLTEIQGLVQLATDRLQRARKDNDTVYLDPVPTNLPEIRAQILVKSNLPLPAAMLQSRVPLFEWTDTSIPQR